MKEPKLSRWEECVGKIATGVAVENDGYLVVAWDDGTYSSIDASDEDESRFSAYKGYEKATNFYKATLLEVGAIDKEWCVSDEERLKVEREKTRVAIEQRSKEADLKKYNELKLKLGL